MSDVRERGGARGQGEGRLKHGGWKTSLRKWHVSKDGKKARDERAACPSGGGAGGGSGCRGPGGRSLPGTFEGDQSPGRAAVPSGQGGG